MLIQVADEMFPPSTYGTVEGVVEVVAIDAAFRVVVGADVVVVAIVDVEAGFEVVVGAAVVVVAVVDVEVVVDSVDDVVEDVVVCLCEASKPTLPMHVPLRTALPIFWQKLSFAAPTARFR